MYTLAEYYHQRNKNTEFSFRVCYRIVARAYTFFFNETIGTAHISTFALSNEEAKAPVVLCEISLFTVIFL